MKKFETIISKRETQTVKTLAESREEVVEFLRQEYPRWQFDFVTEIVKDETEDEDADFIDHEIFGFCETSGKPIFIGDYYYQWGGEDAVMTHLDEGGADENHEPTLAE